PMKKVSWAASAALVVFVPLATPALAQASKKPAATPAPAGGMAVTTSTNTKKPPEGSKPAEIQDIRVLTEKSEDPYELERLGVAAATANELGRAREFLDRSWKVGDLPSAAFNLACIDVREGKHDAAFAHLEKAVAAGFDEDESLLKDADLAPIRDKAKFSSILAGAK